ncbi:MAG: APC family permease, partial [Actinobacteria bacterium]|nr:APC family permease [Actinomycetota bacterium]
IYTATSARLVFGLSKNGFVPKVFQRTSSRDVPIVAIVLSFIVGLIVFFPFPSWIKLVGLIVSANALVYAFAPLVFGALRAQEPERERPFKLPGGSILAPLGFVAANYIVYFTGWVTNSKLFLLVLLGFVVLGISYVIQPQEERPPLEWKATGWMWPYFGGMALLSYLGSFEGGKKTIPFGLDLVVVAVFSVIIYLLAMRTRLDPDRARMYIDATQEEEGVEEPTGDGDGSGDRHNDGAAARVKD